MANRRKGREAALQVLYQFDMKGDSDERSLDEFWKCFYSKEGKNSFSDELVRGVIKNRRELDQMIERFSENWKLPRMPVVDRNLLRMAVYELLHKEDIPVKVTLNEAIEIGTSRDKEPLISFENDRFIGQVFDELEGPGPDRRQVGRMGGQVLPVPIDVLRDDRQQCGRHGKQDRRVRPGEPEDGRVGIGCVDRFHRGEHALKWVVLFDRHQGECHVG